MPLQLDAATQNISTPSGDSGTYTWADIVALGSTLLDTYGTTAKPFYRWRGILTMRGTSTLNALNLNLELYGANATNPGVIRALESSVINFGARQINNSKTEYKNGCNLVLTRLFHDSAQNDTQYGCITYSITGRTGESSKINLYATRLHFNSPSLITSSTRGLSDVRMDVFISTSYDCIFSCDTYDATNVQKTSIYYTAVNGVIDSCITANASIKLNDNTTINNFKAISGISGVNAYLNANSSLSIEVVGANFINSVYDYRSSQNIRFDFLDSPTVNLANSSIQSTNNAYPKLESRKLFSHNLKIVDSSGNVNNALVTYTGRTTASSASNSSGIVTQFKLVVQETNFAPLTYPGDFLEYPKPTPTVSYSSYTRTIKSYLHKAVSENIAVTGQLGTSAIPFEYQLTVDPGITQTDTTTVSAYTGIAHTATTITVTQARTLNEIYDSRKLYWRNNTGVNAPYQESDVFNLGGANLVIDGVALVPSSKFNFIETTGVVTFLNGGDATVSIEDSTGIRTFISITGLIVGSEVRLYNEATSNEFAGTESCAASTQTFAYIYSPGVTVTLVVFKSDYVPVRLTGIALTDTAQSIQVQQRFDRVYTNP